MPNRFLAGIGVRSKSVSRAKSVSRRRVKRPSKRVRYQRALSRSTRFAAKRLGSGVQFHKTGYGAPLTLAVGGTALYAYDTFIRDIPKYRNDPTATARQANLQICRLRDKIYVKGVKVRLGLCSLDPNQNVCVRMLFLRNSAWDENVDTGGSNWYEAEDDGAVMLPSSSMPTAMVQHFNKDLIRNRKDLFFDKKVILAGTSGYTGRSSRYLEFYLPINQLAIFESKGDSASADDISTGRYYLLFHASSNDGLATGDIKIDWTMDFIWSEN